MFKRVMVMSILVASILAMATIPASAYVYKGYSSCYGCGSYQGIWTLAGGQNPDTTSTFLVGAFTFQTGALVCGNPGTNQVDVRGGVGGTTPIVVTNPESDLVVDANGRFTLTQDIPTTVAEFQEFCTAHPSECPQGAQALFEETYDVSNLNCRNPNWTPIEYLWGNHTAEGSVYKDCTDPDNIPGSCAFVDDNVKYSCTTTVGFKNYSKGPVLFSCSCIENCDQGVKK